MAKSVINLPNGTTVTIEGTVAEVAELTALYAEKNRTAESGNKKVEAGRSKTPRTERRVRTKARGVGTTAHIKKLLDDGYFTKAKSAPEIKAELKKKAVKVEMNDLATTLMRQVRSGLLSRVDGDGTKEKPWLYKA